ncbi:MAG: hypothetical protein Kow0059_01380 [Candidatus Sumerlaeia bacterium]
MGRMDGIEMEQKSQIAERVHREGGGLRTTTRIEHRVSVGFSPEPYDPRSFKTPPPMRFGQLRNIGQRGLCFDAPGRFQVNQVISLFLRFTNESSGITMLGKIVWLEPQMDGNTRLGVQFIGPLPSNWRQQLPAGSIDR